MKLIPKYDKAWDSFGVYVQCEEAEQDGVRRCQINHMVKPCRIWTTHFKFRFRFQEERSFISWT